MFQISSDMKSCTKTPGFFKLKIPDKDKEDTSCSTYLVDGAGFNDTNASNEGPN